MAKQLKLFEKSGKKTKGNPGVAKAKGSPDALIRKANTKSGANSSKRSWHWTDYFVSSPLKLPPKNKRTKPVVFVGMSGGVDSSFTAYLLQQQGYQVVGVFMKNWSYPIKRIQECPLYQDYKDMIKACKFLKIPYLVFSFEKDYRKRVIDPFFEDYAKGLTPNPDVLCNTEIKFDDFLNKALKMGADYMATGHHIRSACADPKSFVRTPPILPLVRGGVGGVSGSESVKSVSNQCNQWLLLKGKDPIKDQTYFVYRLTQEQLKKCIFPVGDYEKKDLREMARNANLPTADRRDSQGICFIGNINVKPFLKTRLPEKKGDIVTKEGKKIGEHEGSWFYTIGQRRIEGLSGTVKPLYVIGKDTKKNLVIVGDDKDTYNKSARIKDLHLINKTLKPSDILGKILTAKSRYTPEVSRGSLQKDRKGYYFEFIKPERAITPGQSLVIYKGDVCLGGGIITESI